jgi:uncharacterized Zn finger protein (UPF0148 family)
MPNIKCPNCGSEAIELKGKRLFCADCNVVYLLQEDGSAKPVDTDPLGKVTEKILAEVDKKIDEKIGGIQTEQIESDETDGFIG